MLIVFTVPYVASPFEYANRVAKDIYIDNLSTEI